MINSYLTKATEMDDHGVHLLFAANRWEKKCVLSEQAELAMGWPASAVSPEHWLRSRRHAAICVAVGRQLSALPAFFGVCAPPAEPTS
jgi:hypothetical protein